MGRSKGIALMGLLTVVASLLYLTIKWDNQYLLLSFLLVVVSILFLIIRFEKRKLEAKELVLLAILAAIAAVSRVPFASIPSVQPTTFVIMMAGFVFGAESGLMIGIVAALASNMILGQGPWTPWQMVAWGLVGMSAGYLSRFSWMKTLSAKIIFAIIWGFLFGWIMNFWSLLAFSQSGSTLTLQTVLAYLAGSVLFDFMHAVSNVLFLLLFGKGWIKILTRFKLKYGLLQNAD